MRRELVAALALIGALIEGALIQGAPAQQRPLGARAVDAKVGVKIFNPAGSVRLVGWDKDSLVVRGHIARGERFYLSGDRRGVKLGVETRADDRPAPPCTLVVYVPRAGSVSVKSPIGDISATDVTGWFYTVSGTIRLDGTARSIEALAISGDVDVAVTASVVRAQTGDGRLVLRGAPEDVDVSTVGGRLEVATSGVVRGRFASVSGDIVFTGAPAAGGVLDFTNHGGDVTLLLPRAVAGVFDLSSIFGTIENGMSLVQPASEAPGRGLALRLTLGERGAGGRVSVRTFKGTIRLSPQTAH